MSPSEEAFIPYKTMWRLERRPPADMEFDPHPRRLECVNCGGYQVLRAYLRGQITDNKCPQCGMTAGRYWSRKLYREIPSNA